MRVKNETDTDRYVLGFHFAAGAVVEVPDDLDSGKLDYIARNFTVLPDVETEAPAEVEASDSAVVETEIEFPEEISETPRRRPRRKRSE